MTKTFKSQGLFRRKRGDTLIGTIEKTYNVDLGARADMKLSTYLKKEGLPSLGRAINEVRKTRE